MPDAPPVRPYSLTLSLNVLNHLGINLYSNVPAVLAEVVANSWDADAETVDIEVDPQGGWVRITDDGHGMDQDDINDKYLNVGFQRRAQKDGAVTQKWQRPVMGRKGIGKLSLFSVARVIEVHTVKDGKRNAFRMVLADIEEKIKAGGEGTYYPDPLPPEVVDLERGTRVVLQDLKKSIYQTEAALRKRLARRFSIIGDRYHFNVRINGSPIGVTDREYFNKLQYIWWYGGDAEQELQLWRNEDGELRSKLCPRMEHFECRPDRLDGSENRASGWIGTVAESGSLQDADDNLNKITVLVRGKLAQEDILEVFSEGGMYTKYLIGEIEADFLDLDDREDIADFEVLLRRPELFAVAGFRIRGARRAVLERFGRGLGVPPAVVPVTRALLRAVRHAPEHARRTRRLAPATLAVREVCERTTSPERFLFVELPTALGLPPFDDQPGEADPYAGMVDEFFSRLNAALADLGTVTQQAIAAVRDALLVAACLEKGGDGWMRLRTLAGPLAARASDPLIAAFLRRCSAESPIDDEAALHSALALLANRPPRSWTDADVELAVQRAREVGVAVAGLITDQSVTTVLLTTAEEQQKTVLAARLRSVLSDQTPPPHVVRAALLELLQSLSPQRTLSKEGLS